MEQNVTSRRRKNKLSRKKLNGPSSKTSESSTASCTDTESVNTASDVDNTNNSVKPISWAKTPPALAHQEDKSKNSNLENIQDEKQRIRNISGSTTASLSSMHGSDSDIFRNSDLTPREEDDHLQKSDPLKSDNSTSVDKVCGKKTSTTPEEISTTPCLGSADAAAVASSLESETMLVPPPTHYQKNFAPEIENSEDTKVESASGKWRKTSKRKSFQLDVQLYSEQENKKRKSDEIKAKDNEDMRPVTRRSGRRSSQKEQSQTGLQGSPAKTKSGKESPLVDLVKLSEDPSQIPESASLQTKRRSRLSGSRLGSVSNSPRNITVIPSSGTEKDVVDLTPSPKKEESSKVIRYNFFSSEQSCDITTEKPKGKTFIKYQCEATLSTQIISFCCR